MQLDRVKFEGTGPFYLRAVEHADASALGNTIQLTLYALVDGLGHTPVKIETQMTSRAAERLGDNLLRAANMAGHEIGGYAKP